MFSFKYLNNEKGFALILALAMLAILSILGVFALSTSTTEVGISGNHLSSQQAFFAAERAVEYAMGNVDIVGSTSVTIDLNDHAAALVIGNSGLDTASTNSVKNLGPDELPDALAKQYSREKFGGNYYVINVTGVGPGGKSKTRVESQQVRVFQKDDEGQLITTSGG